ncbi:MAG: hypothetical protein ACAH59_02065 [Pseudobdellovibrionaceae bacterium]
MKKRILITFSWVFFFTQITLATNSEILSDMSFQQAENVCMESAHFCYCYLNPKGVGMYLARVDINPAKGKYITDLSWFKTSQECDDSLLTHPACK